MISLRTNADDFARQLMQELETEAAKARVEMTRRVARHIRNRAEELAPVGTDRRKGAVPLKESFVVSVGEPELSPKRRGSDADAVAVLQGIQPGEAVFVSSTDFTASFFEHGTSKMPPRPLFQPGIEETKEFVE